VRLTKPTKNLTIISLTLIAWTFLSTTTASALDPYPLWFGSKALEVKETQNKYENTYNPAYQNRDCTPRTVLIKKKTLTSPTEEYSTMCATSMAFGLAGESYILPGSGNVAGPLISETGTRLIFIPIPGSADVIRLYAGSSAGLSAYVLRNVHSRLEADVKSNGTVSYRMQSSAFEKPLRDNSGNIMRIRLESVSISGNGKWMIAESTGVGFYRINLETLEVLPFRSRLNYNIGVNPQPKTAISNSGRLGFVGVNTGDYRIFDFEACDPLPEVVTSPVKCNIREIDDELRSIENFNNSFRWRFIGEYGLRTLVSLKDPLTGALSSQGYYFSPSEINENRYEYLALGDSFASGEGARDYTPETSSEDNRCHISTNSYPLLLEQALSMRSGESVACSGATTNDLYNNDDSYLGQNKDKIEKQYRDKDHILDNFLPGYIPQTNFIDRYQPEKLTVSIIGNDIGFSNIIKRCLSADTCYKYYEDRLELTLMVDRQFSKLVELYQNLAAANIPDSKIYVMGYPQLAKPDGNCATNVRLNSSELKFANDLVSYLNLVIKNAAEKAGVFYVDVEDAFDGYELCSGATSHQIAVNGITLRNEEGIFKEESYHPNKNGHRLLKDKLIEKTSGLTAPMPEPNPTSGLPDADNHAIMDAPTMGRLVRYRDYYLELSGDMVFINNPLTLSSKKLMFFKKHTINRIRLLSEPVLVGEVETDENGMFETEITIDETMGIEPGFHTLQIEGINLEGDPVYLEKVVYVAASEDDYRGNGIPNSEEPCLIFDGSGIDFDQDGIDDACDGFVDLPPETEEPPVDEDDDEDPTKRTLPLQASFGINNAIFRILSGQSHAEIKLPKNLDNPIFRIVNNKNNRPPTTNDF
jgi:hypothetical protein